MFIKKLFGHSGWVMPAFTGILGLIFIDSLKNKIKEMRVVLGLALFMVSLSGSFHIFVDRQAMKQAALEGKGGGLVGYFVFKGLRDMVSVYGAIIVLLALVVVSVILIFNTSIDQIIELYREKLKAGELFKFKKKDEDKIEVKEGMAEFDDDEYEEAAEEVKEKKIEEKFEIIPTVSEPQMGPQMATDSDEGSDSLITIAPGSLPYSDKVWRLPSLDLLDDRSEGPKAPKDMEYKKKKIVDTLRSFNISATVKDTEVGPAVTKYIIDTPPGIKLSKVANLQYDLASALASPTGSVRIEAPIPGTDSIGLEVPNETRSLVDFKSIISSDVMTGTKSKIAIALGKDVGGTTHVYDIAKMPHLLIAGATGSGKSVFIHNLIFSIIYRATPQEVKLILMDFKRGVELNDYQDLPHLYTPLVTDIEKAPAVFKWAESEMMRRFKLFESARAKNIEIYNEKSGFQALPYILIIVDELADIMVTDPTAVEKSIIRLAQLARATGIHLVLAVQRPSAEVITGLIKANIPCRIAFNVTRQVDSRIIIDQSGAEKLLGAGDMLFVPPDRPTPVRLQGAFISEAEKNRVTEFLKDQGVPPDYKEEILDTPTDGERGKSIAAGGESTDELYDEAMEIVIAAKKGSASLLQRRLSIGYARAARIIDELHQNGIVGPSQGSRARDVLVDSMPMTDGEDLPDFSEFDEEDIEDY